MASSWLQKKTPSPFVVRTLVGLAVSTPVLAILQGAFLLLDYRMNHGNAPYPETPSRGIVIVQGNEKPATKTTATQGITSQGLVVNTLLLRRHTTAAAAAAPPAILCNNDAPLRILVLGDSLAAGVGMSQSSTPALPESIARGLSQAMGGRAVYWTCLGSPGSTSLEVVGQILDLDDLRAPLISKLIEWQQDTRRRAAQTRRAAKEWWDIHKEPVQLAEEAEIRNPIGRWWKRFRIGAQRDLKNLRKIIRPTNEEDHFNETQREAETLDRKVANMLRRQSLKPAFLAQYDIAVVLCGLNDLKDSFLPFLMPKRKRRGDEDGANDETTGVVKNQLVRIVSALRSRMNIPELPQESSDSSHEMVRLKNDDNEIDTMRADAPLIVFPALPIEPTILGQVIPLRWFLVPLVHAMDRNKKLLADLYPGFVLFIDSPSMGIFSDASQERGSIWEELQREKIVLRLSDVGRHVQNRIKVLMDEHYQSLVRDQGDDLYQLDFDGVSLVDGLDGGSLHAPGASLVASDGIHPNDLGYEVWGRFIARQIVEHLEQDKSTSRQGLDRRGWVR